MNRVWSGGSWVELTAADDGRSHLVAQRAYAEGLAAGTGRYRTLCGRTVLPTALITAPGPACRSCRDAVRATR